MPISVRLGPASGPATKNSRASAITMRFGTVSVKRSVTAASVKAAGKIARIRWSFIACRSKPVPQNAREVREVALKAALMRRRERRLGGLARLRRLGLGRAGIEVVFVRLFDQNLEPVARREPGVTVEIHVSVDLRC